MNNISKNLSRQEQILEIVKDKYRVSIDELAKKFNVTHMTIYRDLEFLENENKIIRTKKSATYITNQADIDYAYSKRLSFNKDEKQAIAKEALKIEANLKMSIIKKSNEVIFLADYSKSNIVSAYTFGSLDVADILITDSRVNKEFIKKLKEKISEIIVAG